MPKEIPDCPTRPEPTNQTAPLSVEVITPMVGGGVTPGETDLQLPVRPTAIRGHLRHWWRLTVGHLLDDVGMWQREEEIFGSTEFPSPLVVRVTACSQVEQFDPADGNLVDRFGPVAYALFASIENKHRVAREGIKFDLMIDIPREELLQRRRAAQNEQRKKAGRKLLPARIEPIQGDIDIAMRTWLALGGLGGRTRRGCGAVNSGPVANDLSKTPGRTIVGKPQNSALAAWREALQAYRDFRQTPRGRKHAKTLRNGRTAQVPGRSHWPEADSIRQITGCSLKPPPSTLPSGAPIDEDTHDHSTPVVPASLVPAFPKAVLGLPINFHFADGPDRNRPAAANLDPQDVQLYPLVPAPSGKVEKAERMASPILTRPLWVDGKWHPGIVILDAPLPEGFEVRVAGKRAALGGDLSHDVPLNRVVGPDLGKLIPMRGQANALDALVEYLTKEQKWRMV